MVRAIEVGIQANSLLDRDTFRLLKHPGQRRSPFSRGLGY
jgi:hypothetical protein